MATNNSENTKAPEAQAGGDETGGKNSFLPLILSGLAVLIAVLALIANQMGQTAPRTDQFEAMNSKLGQIEARIGDVESQVTSDRMDGVQMKLKRILLDLEQLSSLADDATRSKIDQAYHLLKPLSTPATAVKVQVDMQSTEVPENQTQVEGPVTPSAEETAPQAPPAITPEAANDTMEEPAMPASQPASGETIVPQEASPADLPETAAPDGETGQAPSGEAAPAGETGQAPSGEVAPQEGGIFMGVKPDGVPATHL